jgi:hypothetical protein
MQTLRFLALTLLSLPLALAAPQNPSGSQAVTLPSVTATSLDRQKVTLPAAFEAPFNFLILSFQRDQQSVVEGWLEPAGAAGSGVQIWLLPISQRENGVYQWWLNASFRGTQAASLPRRYTVPLYVDKRKFLQSLQVPSEQDVVVLVTDRAGRVQWRSGGPVTDRKKADFQMFLAKAASR